MSNIYKGRLFIITSTKSSSSNNIIKLLRSPYYLSSLSLLVLEVAIVYNWLQSDTQVNHNFFPKSAAFVPFFASTTTLLVFVLWKRYSIVTASHLDFLSCLMTEKCKHGQNCYYCFPPYSTPGGIRDYLFSSNNRILPTLPEEEQLLLSLSSSSVHNNNHTSTLDNNINEKNNNDNNNNKNNNTKSLSRKKSSLLSGIFDHLADLEIEGETTSCFKQRQHLRNFLQQSQHKHHHHFGRHRNHHHKQKQHQALYSQSQNSSSIESDSKMSAQSEPIVTTTSTVASLHPPEKIVTRKQTTFSSVPSALSSSFLTTDSSHHSSSSKVLEPPTLIYHESARSIVFRDHIRRVNDVNSNNSNHSNSNSNHGGSGGPPLTSSTSSIGGGSTISSKSKKLKSKFLKPKKSSTLSSSIRSLDNSQHSLSSFKSNTSKASKTAKRLNSTNHSKASNSHHASGSRADSYSLSMLDSSAHSSSVCSSLDDDDDDTSHQSTQNDESVIIEGNNNKMNNNSNSNGAADDLDTSVVSTPTIIIANFTPIIQPLPSLELGPHDEFSELLQSAPYVWAEVVLGEEGGGVGANPTPTGPENARINNEVWTVMNEAEKEVATMFQQQKCVVKTVRNADWTLFLKKFVSTADYEKDGNNREENDETMFSSSFMTSTTLLPSCGVKMRCYGSTKEYATGIVFALPKSHSVQGDTVQDDENQAACKSNTWSWPSGYAAKTEFNVDEYGRLINGRQEALVSISELRRMNHEYIYQKEYEILGRVVKGGLTTVPYNEVYVRVGGLGRIVEGIDCKTKQNHDDHAGNGRSFDKGLGLPIALFVRTASFGDLIALLRLRARMGSIFGRKTIHSIPLLLITPETGIRVLTETLQKRLLHVMSNSLNPFQNPQLHHKTSMESTSSEHLQQKLNELLDLDDDNIREILTPEECARLAGGFGATDDSVAHLLMDAMVADFEREKYSDDMSRGKKLQKGKLQDLVNEGLSAAVRAGDYNTSRQLLILYTLVASKGVSTDAKEQNKSVDDVGKTPSKIPLMSQGKQLTTFHTSDSELSKYHIPPPPPPPPLDTDRLRSATNSDGLLAVLGAAEVLKSMKDGSAKRRAAEAADALEEWINKSENSVAYRLASWRDLRAAQGDLKIATEQDSNFMAFISNKAVTNRKKFVKELRDSVSKTSFESIQFLKGIHDMVATMHSPCLRLELLQFILGLDNRYSVAHVGRSVELAATCLSISAYEAMQSHKLEAGSHDVDGPTDC